MHFSYLNGCTVYANIYSGDTECSFMVKLFTHCFDINTIFFCSRTVSYFLFVTVPVFWKVDEAMLKTYYYLRMTSLLTGVLTFIFISCLS